MTDLGMQVLSRASAKGARTARVRPDELGSDAVAVVERLAAEGSVAAACQAAAEAIALRIGTDLEVARLRLILSRLLFLRGQVACSVAEAEAVFAMSGLGPSLYASAELATLRGLVAMGQARAALRRAGAILSGGRCAGEDGALEAAFITIAYLAWDGGRVEEALALLRAAVERADRSSSTGRHVYPRLHLAAMSAATGDVVGATALTATASAELSQREDRLWAPAVDVMCGQLALLSGRLDDAVGRARAGLRSAQEHGTPLFVPRACSTLFGAAMFRGDLGEAARLLAMWRAEGPPDVAPFDWAARVWAEARLTEAEQDTGRAVAVLDAAGDTPVAVNRLLLHQRGLAAWWVRAALATGDVKRAAAVASAAEQLACTNLGLSAIGADATHASGLLRRDVAALDGAAVHHRNRWARASAAEDAGALLATIDPSGCCDRLRHALAIYEESGAERDAARVRRRIRSSSGPRARRSRPVSGWDSLTAAERRIALLVAEGLTNAAVAKRSYLSRHTVDFHLRQVFRKLQISSRVELACLVQARKDHAIEWCGTLVGARA